MWWKLLLLTFYLAVLFVLSRILEAVSYYDSGYLASRLLDPVALSVRKLKTLLDQRGVSYAGVVEKQELTELVDASGEVNEGELEVATRSEVVTSSTNFTCGTHFYEEVEDTKDSVWVVQVVRDASHPFMNLDDWRTLIKKLNRFSVRTGIFDCSLDYALCDRKNWYTSRLVMSVPLGHKAKDSVVLRPYLGSTRVQAAFDWVSTNLASRIRQISSLEELQRDWLTWDSAARQPTRVRVVLFSALQVAPMFFSVMSVKFSGRVRFGTVDVRSERGRHMVGRLRLRKVPTYLVLTPEGNVTYGERRGEYLNYRAMCVLLKTLHPEVNDIFLLSLIVVNITCWFDLFVASGVLLRRVGQLLWGIFKWNLFLILLWLPVLAVFQLPYMGVLLDAMLTALRIASSTRLAALLRTDWLSYSSLHCCLLFATFLSFAAATGAVRRILKVSDGDDGDQGSGSPAHVDGTSVGNVVGSGSSSGSGGGGGSNNNNNSLDWWNFNWDGYVNYLFRPMATLTRPMSPQDLDLEVGMELLIERLAVPNFWLTPIISSDYIKELPVWRYAGPTIATSATESSDACSDDGDVGHGVDSSDGDDEPVTQLPYLFTCEKCRALQRERDVTADEERAHRGGDGSRQEAHGDDDEDDEDEDMDSESACAKFLMDGDYKCLCKTNSRTERSGSRHHATQSPIKQRAGSPCRSAGGRRGMAGRRQSPSVLQRGKADTEGPMPPGILASTECVICLEGYRFSVLLCGLPCGHSFHHQCILGWLSRDNHCCPVCRWPTYKAKPCRMHLHAE